MSDRDTRRLLAVVTVLLAPVCLAWCFFSGAATQDGPSHLAAAKIADEWLDQSAGRSPEGSVSAHYRLQFEPVPNWAGQALGMSVIKILTIGISEIVMNLAGLVVLAYSLAWFTGSVGRWTETDKPNSGRAWVETAFLALWIATISTNVLWTLGFTSFLLGLGVALIFIDRSISFANHGGVVRWVVLTCLWCVTFVCHLVPFAIAGLVSMCLVVLAPRWSIGRRAAIVVSMICGLPLWLRYRSLTSGSRLEPIWETLKWPDLFRVSTWIGQLGWVDPITLHSKNWHPITGYGITALGFQTVPWLALATVIVAWLAFRRRNEHQGSLESRSQKRLAQWKSRIRARTMPPSAALITSAFALSILGTFGPDSLGADQGHYLPQRFWLAALCLIPPILASLRCGIPTLALASLAIGWSFQTITAIDFAYGSHRLTQSVRADKSVIEKGDRVLALLDASPLPYRSNPRMHADAVLVTAAPDVVSWNLYEAAHPYFPLRFRESTPGIEPIRLEKFSLIDIKNEPELFESELRGITTAAESRADIIAVLIDEGSTKRSLIERVLADHPDWIRIRSGAGSSIFRWKPDRTPLE